jgi:anaphase-promoting complex subunit 4
MILLASWLAGAARQELARFKEFVGWLRYGRSCAQINADFDSYQIDTEITKNAQTDLHNHPPPRFDILQVNEYIMSGLVDGQIDKWFLGPTPKFSTEDIGISGPNVNVAEVLERSRQFAQDPTKTAWRHVKYPSLNFLPSCLITLFRISSEKI